MAPARPSRGGDQGAPRARTAAPSCCGRDVTAARAQLTRLQEAVALSAEAFAFYDADDRLILANDLYAQLCGVKTLGRADRQDLSGNLRHGCL